MFAKLFPTRELLLSPPPALRSPLRAALLGCSLLAAPPVAATNAIAADSPSQSIQAAQSDYASAQIEISRDFLTELADNLDTWAIFARMLYDFRDLSSTASLPPAASAFYAQIRPMQDWLAQDGSEAPSQSELLQNTYDLINSLRQDLAKPPTDPAMTVLSSNTLQTIRSMAFGWVTSSDNLQKWADAGKLSQPFAKYTGFLSFGAEDLVSGIARGTESGNWQDPDTVSHLLDALNRGAWAAVGYAVSGGNREVADLFSNAAGFIGATARDHTVDMFAGAYMKFGGYDQAILDQYDSAQINRLGANKPAISFENFVNFDLRTLQAIDPTLRSEANARYGLTSPPLPRHPPPITVTTSSFSEHWNETCRSGFCTRTGLAALQPPKVGGVRINPAPVKIGRPTRGLGTGILATCAGASTPACFLH